MPSRRKGLFGAVALLPFLLPNAYAEKSFFAGAIVGPAYSLGPVDELSTFGIGLEAFIGGYLTPGLILRMEMSSIQSDYNEPRSFVSWSPASTSPANTSSVVTTTVQLRSVSLTLVGVQEKRGWFDPYALFGVGIFGSDTTRDDLPEYALSISPGVGLRFGSGHVALTIEASARIAVGTETLVFLPVGMGLSYR